MGRGLVWNVQIAYANDNISVRNKIVPVASPINCMTFIQIKPKLAPLLSPLTDRPSMVCMSSQTG